MSNTITISMTIGIIV